MTIHTYIQYTIVCSHVTSESALVADGGETRLIHTLLYVMTIHKYIQYKIVCSHVTSESALVADSGETTPLLCRGRNVYASLEVLKLWLGCLRTTTVVGTC